MKRQEPPIAATRRLQPHGNSMVSSNVCVMFISARTCAWGVLNLGHNPLSSCIDLTAREQARHDRSFSLLQPSMGRARETWAFFLHTAHPLVGGILHKKGPVMYPRSNEASDGRRAYVTHRTRKGGTQCKKNNHLQVYA